MMNNLLEIKNLKTYFYMHDHIIKAVNDISFDLKKGETLGIVGESGCGKSVSAFSVMRLIPNPPGTIRSGKIFYKNQNILDIPIDEMRKIRGKEISMIFQEPMTALNPVYTIGNQIIEAITRHQKISKVEARKRAIKMLKLVGIPSPEKRIIRQAKRTSQRV